MIKLRMKKNPIDFDCLSAVQYRNKLLTEQVRSKMTEAACFLFLFVKNISGL